MKPVIPGLARNPGFFWIPAFAGMTGYALINVATCKSVSFSRRDEYFCFPASLSRCILRGQRKAKKSLILCDLCDSAVNQNKLKIIPMKTFLDPAFPA